MDGGRGSEKKREKKGREMCVFVYVCVLMPTHCTLSASGSAQCGKKSLESRRCKKAGGGFRRAQSETEIPRAMLPHSA